MNMVILSDRIKLLQAKKKKLLEEQEKLINLLKTKHAQLYNWLTENNVDLRDLRPFSAGIVAAFVVTMAKYHSDKAIAQIEPLEPFTPIETTELYGLDYEQKAKLVWERYGKVIQTVADKYELDPALIFATVMVESGGNTYAVRYEPAISDASYGLGQLLYGTATLLGFDGRPQDLYDPKVNLELVGLYHRRNLNVYGELTPQELATAYNAGSPYSYPTVGHVEKFMKFFNLAKEVSNGSTQS